MTSREVTIRISAKDDFSTVVDKYKRAMGGAEDSTRRVGKAAERNRGLFAGMGQELQGALAGVTVGAAFGAIGRLNDLGMRAGFVSERFDALAGDGEAAMRRLRDATGGVVDDTTLMEQATGLMLTQVASDVEQASDIIATGLQLGGEQGVGLLQQVLKNGIGSKELLDSLGISASEASKIYRENLARGLNENDAWRDAILSLAEETKAQLGEAADAGVTSFGRVGTFIENLVSDIGENVVAAGLEAGAQLVELGAIAVTHLDQQNREFARLQADNLRIAQEAAQRIAAAFTEDTGIAEMGVGFSSGPFAGAPAEETFGMGQFASMTERAYSDFTQLWGRAPATVDELANSFETVFQGVESFNTEQERFFSRFLEQRNVIEAAIRMTEADIEAMRMVQDVRLAEMIGARDAELARRQELARRTAAQMGLVGSIRTDELIGARDAEIRDRNQETQREADRVWSAMARHWAEQEAAAMAPLRERMASNFAGVSADYADLFTLYGGEMGQRGRIGEQTLFLDSDVRHAEDIASSIDAFVDFAEQNVELIDEADLERAREMADEAGKWRDYIVAGKDAAAEMTMPQLFGQVSGGLLGELGGSALDYMRDVLPGDEYDALEDSLMLRTGQRTAESESWENEVLPALAQIYEDRGEQAFITALASYERGMHAAAERGYMPEDPLGFTGFLNVGAGGPGYTVQPDDGHWAIAQNLDMSVDDLYARGIVQPDQTVHPGEQFGGGMQLAPIPGLTAPWGPAAYDFAGMGPHDNIQSMGTGPLGAALQDVDALKIRMQDILGVTSDIVSNTGDWSDALGSAPVEAVAGGASKLAIHNKEAADQALRMRDYIAEVSSKVHVVKLQLEADDKNIPQWMNDWLKAGLAQIVQNNGGAVPGVDRRGGR